MVATQAAAFTVRSPEPYNFQPEEWLKWKRRFERFRLASGLNQKTEEEQINTMIFLMGDQADDIFLTFALSAADKKIYASVLKAFDDYFIIRRNVIYERAKFNSRCQKEGEKMEDFITNLYSLAEHCEYGTLHNDMIRDRIVVGVINRQLSDKLQLDNALTLETAINKARQFEAVKRQQSDLRGETDSLNVDRVDQKKKNKFKKKNSQKANATEDKTEEKSTKPEEKAEDKCSRCGGSKHRVDECPAKDKECFKCKRIGHYSKHCKSRRNLNRLRATEGGKTYLFAVSARERQRKWTATVNVNGVPIYFKLDPGADVTVIPYHLFQRKWKGVKLVRDEVQLAGPAGGNLENDGKFIATLKSGKTTIEEPVYVVQGLERPLLGIRACEDLLLVKRLDNVSKCQWSKVNPKKEFPTLFRGLGKMDEPYDIKLKENSEPYAVSTPRRVPLPLMRKLKNELEEMAGLGVIVPVDEPTEWCAPIVIENKPNGRLRICVDLTRLNKSVERERHPMPSVEHNLGQLGGAKYFSKIDANSGFWQIKLSDESAKLTTFITPFGRFYFTRLPFGITSAPEVFQKRMMRILAGLEGVVCHMDDVLVWGATQEEHDERLRAVLQRLRNAGVTLNDEKCEFGVESVKFLGHKIDANGIHADEDLVAAIEKMEKPTNITEVRRFLGMVNYLGRFVPRLSDRLQPLNELLKKKNQFLWGPQQQASFEEVKVLLASGQVLAKYDAQKPTIVSADASSYGIGAVLKQEQEDKMLRAVAFASRSLSSAEKRYAQIEKEALAMTWASDRFRDFLYGMEFQVETDHKPLVPIFTTKLMDDLSPRLQRFKMRMMRYSFTIFHTPGKDLIVADTLSRQPPKDVGDPELEEEVTAYVRHIMASIPTSDERLEQIWKGQQEDRTLKLIAKYATSEWPEKKKLTDECKLFWPVRDEINVTDGLLMRGSRIIIPSVLRQEILFRLHEGHLGITKCRMRARETVWWPGISQAIEEMIKRCRVCVQEQPSRHQPLMPTEFPTRPWQRIAMDLFYHNKSWFLVVTDYYSRYPELAQLEDLSAATVIAHCKAIFARHGVPEVVMSDNGPQFKMTKTSEFTGFARDFGFKHVTSSPKYAQSNGFAEAAVKIVKQRLKKNGDPVKALLEYRATPLQNGYSPAELLMGRKIRTTLPMAPVKLLPQNVDVENLRGKEESRRSQQKRNYDRRHGVVERAELTPGEIVWVKDARIWGKVVSKANTPRSYVVETPRGTLRRNSFHLTTAHQFEDAVPVELDEGEAQEEIFDGPQPEMQQETPQPYRTRSGRAVKPPRRLITEI